jgi:hypothetical protein
MKAIAISVVVILAAMKVASGQTSPSISTRTINLTVEQYHIIKENVLKNAQVESRPGLPPGYVRCNLALQVAFRVLK